MWFFFLGGANGWSEDNHLCADTSLLFIKSWKCLASFFFCFTIFDLRLFQMMYVVKVQGQDWKCNLLWPCSADGGNVGVEATDWEKWSRLFFWCFRFWNDSSVLHHGRYKHINYTLYKSTYINIQTTYYVYPPIYKKDAINSRSCVLQNPKLSCFSLSLASHSWTLNTMICLKKWDFALSAIIYKHK